MPQILYAGLEGEYALFPNTLAQFGEDDQRRGSVELEDGDQVFRPITQAPTDFWMHVRLAVPTPSASHADTDILTVYAGGNKIAQVINDGINNAFVTIRFRVGDSDTTRSIPFTMVSEQFYNFDIHVNAAGQVTFYMDEVFRYRANVGAVTVDACMVAFSAPSGTSAATKIQDFIITDGLPTVGMELVSLPPAALGNYNGFTNDYNSIAGPGYDNTTTIYTPNVGDRESWIYADSDFDLGDKIIYAFVMSTVAQLSIAGSVTDFRPFLRIAGVDYDGSALGATNVAPDNYATVFFNNPATGNPWQRDDFRALEGGVRTV